MDTTSIYALRDPDSLETRYIGKADDPDRRLREHWARRSQGDDHKQRWLRTLSRRPILTVIETVPGEQWQERERYWIAKFKECGYKLVNGDNGGHGPGQWTPEMRAKMSAHYKGFWRDPAYRSEMARKLPGIKKPESHRRALSLIHQGEANLNAKLTEDDVREIRFLRDGGAEGRALSFMYGISEQGICDIVKRRTWKHVV